MDYQYNCKQCKKDFKSPYKNGERICWSKGLTAKTDERINKMSITILEGYQNGKRKYGRAGPGPYCDDWRDQEYKNDIKERDNYECQGTDCLKKSKVLCIHHIDYDKRNCKPNNLITLCKSCHSRTNFNRNYWENIYKSVANG